MGGKVYDRRRLEADRDPRKQLATEVGKFKMPPFDPIRALARTVEFFRDFGIQAIKQITGIDLTSFETFMTSLLTATGINLILINNIIGALRSVFGNTPAEVAATAGAIKSSVFGSTTVYLLTGTGNFTVPDCARIQVAVTNGGNGGQAGTQTATPDAPGGEGGQHGGYVLREFLVAELGGVGAVIPFACGAPGGGGAGANYANGAAGGVSRFGSSGSPFVVGTTGATSVESDGQFVPSVSHPGAGGQGGRFSTTTTVRGIAGGTTPLAAGGAGGLTAGTDGSPGGAAVADRTPSGGGGGGGGAGNEDIWAAGKGGKGGNYGAGGGGGGSTSDTGVRGAGGDGAAGAIWAIAKGEAA